ncbi:complement component C8 alpha chain [Melanotaenia boesemani]|uniref:complement component C8 alpha chain n=1 Tax=Melanotaenia boesemani TaxID=1250792 RepID=UPI001C05DE99|nr:complement component C8 alpha chain [Melanotaenia boesemani]
MGTFIHVFLSFCTLHLFVNFSTTVDASRTPWTNPNARKARSVNTPVPIECKMGPWSSWTQCNSCTDKAFRYRLLEKPSQFGGSQCVHTLWDSLVCPRATTQCMVPDYCGESFTCANSGRCISQSLKCNGENDCGDFSDEDACTSFNRRQDKCATLLTIPGAKRGTQGYNILTGDFANQVLDPEYFGGMCDYVYNGEWRKFQYDAFCDSLHYNDEVKNYRKPYNYHNYRFVAEATTEGSHEYFEDMESMLKARKTFSSVNAGVTVGVYYVEAGLSGSSESEFLKNVTKYENKELGFVRLWSKVQTAHFKMRSSDLMLHDDFYFALMDLPEQYDFGMYSNFLKTFGTHYVTEGVMGGNLEYVFVLNKTTMATSNVDSERTELCIGASLGISYPVTNEITVGGKIKAKGCGETFESVRSNSSSSSVVEDVITSVKGGVTETSAGLLVIRDTDTYRKWGASLKYHPALIDFELMPIYELVRFSTAAGHAGARVTNLERALDEYLQQFDPCRCSPCRHNGMPVLAGTSCKCLCKSGFQGKACERTLRRDAKTDGLWSCWGTWSSCTTGRKTRSRSCNNPAPDGGGAFCLGSSTQTRHC